MYFYGNSSLDTRVNGTLAMSLYAEAAALGAPRAQFHVGVALSYGLWGSPLDEAAAMTHYYFAALGGDIGASMALGHKHLLGLGAPKKCESAVRYYEVAANEAVARREQNASHPAIYDLPHRRLKTVAESQHKKNLPGDSAIVDYYQFSADKGDPDATLNLATFLGIGVPQNNATAFKYLQEAVNEGNTAAQNELAHMYLLGKGTEQDEEQAVSLFKAAAKQGSMDAFYNLGVLHVRGVSSHKLGHMSLHGIGTTRSCKNAVESFKMVAERGEWDRILSQAYKDFKRQDYEASFMKYAVMAQQGYEVAQHNAAYLLDYDFLAPSAFSPMLSLTPSGMELENDIVASTAVMLYRLAAQQGNVDANLKIGDYYYYGKGGHPVDFVKASAHYSLASKRSNAQAMFNLALMYEHGIGVDQDFYLAKRFFDKARVSHSDASVPVTLALWKLRAHKSLRSWKRWWDELVGNVAPSKKVFSASEASTSGSSQSNWWPGDATFSTDMMLQDVFTNWREVLQSDNFLIFVLTIALGVVLYIRSERQYLQAPPPQQQPQ
uniref:Uncharacterized protein n=1 Tax=Phytophthora ramorum TaxID=164328 RepID=H3HDC8_PHYRM